MEYKFECIKGCSNCCKVSDGFVFLTEKEAQKIADYLQKPVEEFYLWFTKKLDDRLCLVDGDDENCVFIENSRCLIYPVRPQQCRDYPFWPEIISTIKRWEQEKSVCPGIGKGKTYTKDEIDEIIFHKK